MHNNTSDVSEMRKVKRYRWMNVSVWKVKRYRWLNTGSSELRRGIWAVAWREIDKENIVRHC
jgi:hypothetical protein